MGPVIGQRAQFSATEKSALDSSELKQRFITNFVVKSLIRLVFDISTTKYPYELCFMLEMEVFCTPSFSRKYTGKRG